VRLKWTRRTAIKTRLPMVVLSSYFITKVNVGVELRGGKHVEAEELIAIKPDPLMRKAGGAGKLA